MKHLILILLFTSLWATRAFSQIVLLGDNAPYSNILDGDFNAVWANWRAHKQSPDWKTKVIKGNEPMGLSQGRLFCMDEEGIAESKVLDANPDYQHPKAGDILNWSFGADLEYICHGTISLSLVFGKHEEILAKKVKLIGSDKTDEHFSGTYTITAADAKAGLPFVRATFYSEKDVKVYLDYVNISVVAPDKSSPVLQAKTEPEGIGLSWTDKKANAKTSFNIYRMQDERKSYYKIGNTSSNRFIDSHLIDGIKYTYVITRFNQTESVGSNKVSITKMDDVPPLPPTNLKTKAFDAEVEISWQKSTDNDVATYSVFRRDSGSNRPIEIASGLKGNSYVDFTPTKSTENIYVVYAQDYSGNVSLASAPVSARVKMVSGASFSDLILPMPIHKEGLRFDLWGAKSVLPRDPENGIEDPNWSYWGGHPVKDKDGKYHMLVVRWPANATKGHWDWPNSTVASTVSDRPDGPYRVIRQTAYDYENGLGHNADVVLLNDGSYLLYALIKFIPHLFKSQSMSGPWKHLGVLKVDTTNCHEIPKNYYRFGRNLSGVQLKDGRILFVTKAGAMMISEGTDPLGPYKVLTAPLQGNKIIPEKYRNSNYEDPVIWKDEVQYHMIINAFSDFRAIYLRSPDGIHWKFNPGTAYTPNNTLYDNGQQTHWYKLERPHIIQDEYGRAIDLSLAAIDVPKEDDLPHDIHNSKNIILPLVVPKRLKILNNAPIDSTTKMIRVLVISEPGFNAQKDIDLSSVRFGASEEVNYGRGCKVADTINQGKDLLIEFNGVGNGITKDDFVCKLLGKTNSGQLLSGYARIASQ